jgi:hypothetical protein
VIGVAGFRQTVRIVLQRWFVDVGGTLHFQRFVGSPLVEVLTKPIQLLLLGESILAHTRKDLFFQGAMHALMPAVLLRLTRFDTLELDSQTYPPDRQRA